MRNGTTVDLDAYASLSVGGRVGFYEVDLLAARVSGIGGLSPRHDVTGIAIRPNQR